MTTYNTGNPIGSTDARDLYDNAQNLDNFANGTAASYTDRLGVSRRSLSGIDAAADNVLNGIGYAVPVAYASGISLTLTSQTVDYNGVIYAPKSSALPFITSSWGTDSSKFRAIQVTDADLITYTPAGTGAVATTVQSKLRETVSVKDFGAVGDNVTDDTNAIKAAIASVSSGGSVFVPRGVYVITDTIRIPSRVHFYGEGEISQLEWGGATPAAGSKFPMVAVSEATNPSVNAVANTVVSDIHLDCRDTPNLVGIEFVYASFQSQGRNIRVSDVGANGAGFRFCREWYASFDTLSVRCATKNSGSIGFWFDTAALPVGEINGVPFRNLQTNKCSIGILIDTTSYLYACTIDAGVFEQGDVGIRHIGKKGVRQMEFNGIYLESNTIMVDWTRDSAPTDSSQQVMWNNIQTQIGTSTWNIAEGRHWIKGCDSITTLNNSGAQIRVDGDALASIVNTGTGRTIWVGGPTQLPQGSRYASVFARHQAVATVRNIVPAATTTTTVPLPADLLDSTFPSNGREVYLRIFGRNISQTQNRWWEGYLVQRANQSWALFKASYTSTEDATWTVSVNSTTGELTILWNNTSENKVLIASYQPL